jgi:hypothetical protein
MTCGLISTGSSGLLKARREALECAYRVLGFESAVGGDDVFRQLVLARITEPVSIRVLEEACAATTAYCTIERRLRVYAEMREMREPGCDLH